ncbi:hypothetical protein HR45_03885 [Shewanella mangrovi]|uniref:Carboxypeptidase regulatory-like domain-containing protein n=2 Tax=Shewanella mangrovi TaxID=1515746 RepID=A0A094LTN8_9GAMM|nr:hypothetical protein HR45_03885 [Shewanella mangrovi]
MMGCNSDTQDDGSGETGCSGFLSPVINVRLHDSIDDNLVIDDATVLLIETSDTGSNQDYATYIADDDNLAQSETGAYFSVLSINAMSYLIDIEVTAEGYNSAVVKNIAFEVDSSCGAENTLSYDVYLCPINSNCL